MRTAEKGDAHQHTLSVALWSGLFGLIRGLKGVLESILKVSICMAKLVSYSIKIFFENFKGCGRQVWEPMTLLTPLEAMAGKKAKAINRTG